MILYFHWLHLLYFGSLIFLNILNILKKDLEYFKTPLTDFNKII